MEASWKSSSSSSIFLGTSEVEVPETSASFVYTSCATFGKRWWRTGSNVPSSRFFFGDASRRHHFLDTCFLCKKPIAGEEVFMYRGDAPFCSEECRQEQVDMDEALEDDRILSRSSASLNNASSSMKRKPTLIFTPNDHFGGGGTAATVAG